MEQAATALQIHFEETVVESYNLYTMASKGKLLRNDTTLSLLLMTCPCQIDLVVQACYVKRKGIRKQHFFSQMPIARSLAIVYLNDRIMPNCLARKESAKRLVFASERVCACSMHPCCNLVASFPSFFFMFIE